VEPLERAPRHRDGGIGRRSTGRERVDARLALEHVDLGSRQAGRDRHLLDDVQQPLAGEIGRIARHLAAAEHPRDLSAAAGERRRPIRARREHEPERADGDEAEKPPMLDGPRPEASARVERHCAARAEVDDERDERRGRGDDRGERRRKCGDEHAARAPGPVLSLEKVQRSRARGLQPNETAGTVRFCSSSISRNSAVLKLNRFATRLPGKLSHAVLYVITESLNAWRANATLFSVDASSSCRCSMFWLALRSGYASASANSRPSVPASVVSASASALIASGSDGSAAACFSSFAAALRAL